jgi:hypothetical protein
MLKRFNKYRRESRLTDSTQDTPAHEGIDQSLPQDYKHLVSEEEYRYVITLVQQSMAALGKQILKIDEGIVSIARSEGEDLRLGLDNLLRRLRQQDREEWPAAVHDHMEKLGKLDEQQSAYTYFFKDFDYSYKFLKLLVKPEGFAPADFIEQLIHRQDVPGTRTFLVMDYADQFRFINRDDIGEWERTEDELFEVAQSNMSLEEVAVRPVSLTTGQPMFVFFSGDYSAGYALDFQRNANFAIGEYGAIVALPSKGMCLAVPIHSAESLAVLEQVVSVALQCYTEEQGPISPELYWWFAGQFHYLVRMDRQNPHKFILTMPQGLADLLFDTDPDTDA